MLKFNILIAIRNITRNLKYTVINIGGLAIGLTCFIFIALYIGDELKYDQFYTKSDRIYRANRFYNSNDVQEDAATCSFPFGPTLQFDYPDMVEHVVRFYNGFARQTFIEYRKTESEVVKFNETGFYLVDSTVFKVFSFKFLHGNPETALNRPNTIVISSSTARKYFGDESALGKLLRLEESDRLDFEVTGVIEDIPPQSHFEVDMLGSLSTMRQFFGNGQLPQTWIWNPCWTYVLLSKGTTQSDLEAIFPAFYLNHYPDLSEQDVTLYLQPITDIHLKSHHVYEMHPNSNIQYIYILSAIAAIVLILACINFMNMATAYSSDRAKEIGLKKVFGSSRTRITWQFINETILQTFLAMVIAIILVESLMISFNHFTNKNISGFFIFEPQFILSGILLVIIVGFLAGSYPALYLSSFNPLNSLKDLQPGGTRSGFARKVLVVLQFSISIALIIGTFIVFNQIRFIRNADLGFNKDQIILLPTVNQISQNYETFKNELLNHPDILFVTGMEDILGVNHNTRQVVIEGLNPDQGYWYPMFMVRHDFIETFDIKVVAGRAFSKEILADTANAIMINETMAANLGWNNEDAIGKRIRSDGDERVIGVFKDFHILSLHKPMNNFILDMLRNPRGANGLTRYVAVRTNTENYNKVLSYIEEKWLEIAPSRPFEYTFHDQELNSLYKDEDQFSRFSILLTFLGLFIASLGLVGLTSYMAEKRTKEIGIRKAMGASTGNIIKELSIDFIKLILISNLIAWPAAYIFTSNWLQNFTQRIPINWLLFLLAGIITLLIALAITSFRAYLASTRNPAETLRYE
ncbi:ABC transporter permease [Bacteroidota bacterium]